MAGAGTGHAHTRKSLIFPAAREIFRGIGGKSLKSLAIHGIRARGAGSFRGLNRENLNGNRKFLLLCSPCDRCIGAAAKYHRIVQYEFGNFAVVVSVSGWGG
jgi:hypothetical protein